jgi:hypothetical protein
MAFSLYCLFVSCVLFANSVAIINERFLRRLGFEKPGPEAPHSLRNRLLTLLYGDFKLILQMPLIWINALVIISEIIFG